MVNCIILADKESSILLNGFVAKTASLINIGSFLDLESAIAELSIRKDVHLAFLDLDNLKVDCFEFISRLEHQPNIIVVSSGGQNALRAFDFNVVDYLLKPVTYSRFLKAVDKVIRYYSPREIRNNQNNEIYIKSGSALVKLKMTDIIYVEALENYVILHTNNERFTIHFTMKGIENHLPAKLFSRIHRSFLVNKSCIRSIRENTVDILIEGTIVNLPIGKSFRDHLLSDINLIEK